MVGLPVAVFLHNRFSSLVAIPFLPSCVPSSRLHHTKAISRPNVVVVGGSVYTRLVFGTSSYLATQHRPPPTRGGLYLNNIHELRYTRQIYCPSSTADSTETLATFLPPSSSSLSSSIIHLGFERTKKKHTHTRASLSLPLFLSFFIQLEILDTKNQ